MNPFNWLRNRTRDSILLGCADALAELGATDDSQPLTLADLQQLLALRHAESEEEPTSTRKKKGT